MMAEHEHDRVHTPTAPNAPTPDAVESPGLPWLRTWRGVYYFVLGCFILYVILLAVLSRIYS